RICHRIQGRQGDYVLLIQFIGKIGTTWVKKEIIKTDMCPYIVSNIGNGGNSALVVDDSDKDIPIQVIIQIHYYRLQGSATLASGFKNYFLRFGLDNFYPGIGQCTARYPKGCKRVCNFKGDRRQGSLQFIIFCTSTT